MDTPRCWNCSLDLSKVKLVRIQEAARMCQVDAKSVRRWMEEGDVEWLCLPHGKPRLVSDTLPTGRQHPPSNGTPPRPSLPIRSCFVCGRPSEHSRILLDADQARRLCRVSRRTVAAWAHEGLVESEQGYFYLDSLFQEPRRHRDLDVRR